ncbi:MAG: purine nucleoside permease [Sphingomonadales bacterium]|nr:purine nucleoside permease [Sphingomonadales bacterium]MBU3993800.1 purine nucleoside permease [Alphaproteobacteria bacterium]
MRFPTWLAALAIAGLSPGAAGQAAAASVTPAPVAEAAPVADKATIAAVTACTPGGPCAHRLPVRVVVVTMFEVGKDSGDAPGEFQFWKERRGLNTRIAFPQSHHDLYYNPATGVLGMVTGMGSIRAATATLALGLDPRFDLSQAYWLVAGIAGIDPQDASIGSAAWAQYLVDGDISHEIDAREIPKDWKSGYFALHSRGPADPKPLDPVNGEMFELNPGLTDWAFDLTRNLKLPDSSAIAAERARYAGYPLAQRPPFVLKGDQLAAMTFWHGKLMNDWGNDWVRYWTRGKGQFVTSAMEETGTFQSIEYLAKVGRADRNRVLVLRAGSNFTMPPPGVSAAEYLLRENEGYAGMIPALESLYLVGSKVIDELLGHWDRYAGEIPDKVPAQ